MKRTFQIYRYDPDTDEQPRMQVIELEVPPGDRMLLDVLTRLKAIDPSLSFRRSCREGICGSDAMNINGRNGLACITNMRSLPNTGGGLGAAKPWGRSKLKLVQRAPAPHACRLRPNRSPTPPHAHRHRPASQRPGAAVRRRSAAAQPA